MVGPDEQEDGLKAQAVVDSSNPLLDRRGLPRFESISAEHVIPAVQSLLSRLSQQFDALEAETEISWSALADPLDRIEEELRLTWGTVRHLLAVKNTTALREAYEEVQPEVVKFYMRVRQSRPLYQRVKQLAEQAKEQGLGEAQQRILESAVRAAEEAGVGLDGEARERFNEIQLESARLRTEFSNQLLDATKAFALELEDPADVAGLPQSALELAAQNARDAGNEGATATDGPWRITLDFPSFRAFMQHSKRPELREKLYRAQITRASSGPFDNTPLVQKTLELRQEKAKLLGYPHYASVSLSSKMAPDVEAVEKLLEELRVASHPYAKAEHEALQEFAEAQGHPAGEPIRHWDVAYWAERQREEKFSLRDEELRPYFPLDRVQQGLFDLCSRLLDIVIEPAQGEAEVWHPDVQFFHVKDRNGQALASFYLDPYSRPQEKRGGAWMDDCMGRSCLHAPDGQSVRNPVAYLVCNQTPPVGDRPSLMTFGEVRTLFHEFGHGLQHMLTTVDYVNAAGTNNVEWDAVEIPSLFMENWCYHEETLDRISGHYETGAPLPPELKQRILEARNYRTGSQVLRQLYFGFTDLALHSHYDPTGPSSPFDEQRRIAESTTILAPLPEDRFLCSFSHIFAGGYAAGYYSYHWAQVLSADAFSAFEEAGLEDEEVIAATGRRFRDTILALGGSRAPATVFESFRGRAPTTEAMLRHSGLR